MATDQCPTPAAMTSALETPVASPLEQPPPHPLPDAPQQEKGSLCASGGFLCRVVVLCAMSSVLSGYDQGVIAGAMLTLAQDLSLSSVEQEVCIGILNLAAALGGVATGMIADAKGRRWTITLANMAFLLGSILLAAANGFPMLMAGRVLMGLGVGIALVIAPVFTAELAPPSLRGSLVALADLATNLGILMGYGAGLAFYGVECGWRGMFGLGTIPAVMLAVLIWTVPESVRWLVMQGRDAEAADVLRRVGRGGDPSVDLAAIKTTMQSTGGGAPWKDLFCPRDRPTAKMLIAGLGVAFFSQACGTEAVTYYVPHVMESVGLDTYEALVATMAAGGCKVVFLLAASLLFDKVGRKPMLIISALGLALSFSLIAASYLFDEPSLSIGGVCGVMGSFSLGFSPLVYIVGTEVFPNALRAKAMAFALFLTRMLAGMISISFITLNETLGPIVLWSGFGVVSVAAATFVCCFVPETKGLALEHVRQLFESSPSRAPHRPLIRNHLALLATHGGVRSDQPQNEISVATPVATASRVVDSMCV